MRFLLLILSLGFFATMDFVQADPFEKIENMIADDRTDKGANINHSEPLSKVMINSKMRQEKATPREFLLMIQAWDYLAKNSGANATKIKKKLLDSHRTDKNNAYIAFNYLLARKRDSLKSDERNQLSTTIRRSINATPNQVLSFFNSVERAIGRIAEEQKTALIDIAGEEDEKENGIILGSRYNPFRVLQERGHNQRDYRTTDRLVTFTFNENNDITGCVSPNMDEFSTNPFAIYRRPVPTPQSGIEGSQAKNFLRLHEQPPFLYQILLTDKEGNDVIYGLTNPYSTTAVETNREKQAGKRNIEIRGKLVQLSRGTVSRDMGEKVTAVEAELNNSNYLLYPMQLMNAESDQLAIAAMHTGKHIDTETQPGVVLGDVHLPMLDYLIGRDMLIQSHQRAGGKNAVVNAKEVGFDQDNVVAGVRNGVHVPIAYFKDTQLATDFEIIQDGKAAAELLLAAQKLVVQQREAGKPESEGVRLAKIMVIKIEKLLQDWPRYFLIKSSRDGEDIRNDSKLDYVYVLRVLYRWDAKTETLVQVSMGIPEPSIRWRKGTLEDDIKRDEKRKEADPKRKNYLAP
ncbi:MAG: hypothetical protein WCG04_06315 [Alphaproteobacteria bacterium]